MPKRSSSLAGRLMAAQLLVIGAGGISLVVAATLIAPRQFRTHLALAGENAPEVTKHAEAAFSSAFSASLAVALVAALTTAAVVSWFLVRRVTRPVEELARAADSIAAGEYRVAVPSAGLGSELGRLSDAFIHMTGRLSDADAARSRLLADLAHELRTPLATLEAYIDGMEDGVVPEDAASWSTMRGQVARLHRLATDLREVASAEEHTLVSALRPTSVDEVCDAAIASARPRYQAGGVALTFVGPARMPEVLADAGRLHQVLVNLLDNALKYSPGGTRIQLRVRQTSEGVDVEVIDDGIGIPDDAQKRIFDKFYRADPDMLTGVGGSGLGLYISRELIEQMGGTISVRSRPGEGSTFDIHLPKRRPR